MKWRTALVVTTLALATAYALVVLVALVTSGNELHQDPLAYYAGIMPFVYFTFCLLTAAERIPTRHLGVYGIVMHIAVAPCLIFSFLGLGMLLPLLAFLWFRVYRCRLEPGEGATSPG